MLLCPLNGNPEIVDEFSKTGNIDVHESERDGKYDEGKEKSDSEYNRRQSFLYLKSVH